MKRLFLYSVLAAAFGLSACTDNDSFTTSSSAQLVFSADTVSLDTVFSTVPTSTHTFWVFNQNGDGLRLRQVRLQRGNQSGYRVNVDGSYLDNTIGSKVNDLEIRKGDSIRVFVELTSPTNHEDTPQLVEDNLIFTLESGVEQKVCLRAYSWDALLVNDLHIKADTTISTAKPIVVRGGITVDSMQTLTIAAPATLYFHDGAGMDVYGRLVVQGNPDKNVVMRGDRTDRMFTYLPYDRVSGQWKGVRLYSSSTANHIDYADIHSSTYGILVDSAAYDSVQPRLTLNHSTIHNCKGPGLQAVNAYVNLFNSQLTNTLGDCVAIYGGAAQLVYCTLGQFYPFSGDRGAALRFTNFSPDKGDVPLHKIVCYNTLATGYDNDVIMGEVKDSTLAYNYYFSNCLLRTPPVTDSLQLKNHFQDVLFEEPKDSVNGKMHFLTIDEDNMYYDFRLDSLSTARGKATPLEGFGDDRNGHPRSGTPDIGCYMSDFAQQQLLYRRKPAAYRKR